MSAGRHLADVESDKLPFIPRNRYFFLLSKPKKTHMGYFKLYMEPTSSEKTKKTFLYKIYSLSGILFSIESLIMCYLAQEKYGNDLNQRADSIYWWYRFSTAFVVFVVHAIIFTPIRYCYCVSGRNPWKSVKSNVNRKHVTHTSSCLIVSAIYGITIIVFNWARYDKYDFNSMQILDLTSVCWLLYSIVYRIGVSTEKLLSMGWYQSPDIDAI